LSVVADPGGTLGWLEGLRALDWLGAASPGSARTHTGSFREIGGTLGKRAGGSGRLWIMWIDDRKLADLVKEAVENA
jgi:hypothetical protein